MKREPLLFGWNLSAKMGWQIGFRSFRSDQQHTNLRSAPSVSRESATDDGRKKSTNPKGNGKHRFSISKESVPTNSSHQTSRLIIDLPTWWTFYRRHQQFNRFLPIFFSQQAKWLPIIVINWMFSRVLEFYRVLPSFSSQLNRRKRLWSQWPSLETIC